MATSHNHKSNSGLNAVNQPVDPAIVRRSRAESEEKKRRDTEISLRMLRCLREETEKTKDDEPEMEF